MVELHRGLQMRILEVRDGFIKIESEECLNLTSFLRINSFEKSYIAQIIQVKNSGSVYVAVAKFVYIYNETIVAYDKTLPPRDSSVEKFDFANINSYFDVKIPLIPAKFVSGENVKLDKDVLSSLLLSIDSPDKTNTLIGNMVKQSDKNIVIDLRGNIEIGEKYIAGVDFKLPLNTSTLQFMYADCLNDATSDSKDLVKEIFSDLAAYSKTVEFLPFKALKTIVDDMVDKSHIFKLLVLKTKLAKFEKAGYFAGTKAEADKLSEIIKKGNAVLDLSKLDTIFQNRYLETIMQIIDGDNSEIEVFTNLSNLVNKKNLKKIVQSSKHNVILSADSKFKYVNDIKAMYKNFLIEPSFVNKSVFKPFVSILSSMGKDEVLFVGECSDRLPLVLSAEQIELTGNININTEESEDEIDLGLSPEEAAIAQKSDELISQISDEIKTESSNDIVDLFSDAEDEPEEEQSNAYETPLESGNDYHTKIDSTQTVKVPEEILDVVEVNEVGVNEEINTESDAELTIESDTESDDAYSVQDTEATIDLISPESDNKVDSAEVEIIPNDDYVEPEVLSENEVVIPQKADDFTVEEISEDALNDDEFDAIVELDESEITDDDILVDMAENSDFEESEEDELDKEIVEDVDKVYTTIKDDTISDEDLDFIDELNGDISVAGEELVISDDFEAVQDLSDENDEPDFLEPLEEVGGAGKQPEKEKEILETKNSTTPIVPVYDAEIPQEDRVVSDPIEQGDTVVHAKYGTGVVEKMIKYGAKNLYSINFDNVGRRLLDPTLTEIKKA